MAIPIFLNETFCFYDKFADSKKKEIAGKRRGLAKREKVGGSGCAGRV